MKNLCRSRVSKNRMSSTMTAAMKPWMLRMTTLHCRILQPLPDCASMRSRPARNGRSYTPLLLTGLPEGTLSQFCRDHLRIFCWQDCWTHYQRFKGILLDRMRRLPKETSFEELQCFRDALSTRDWFRIFHRILDDREQLEPFRYPSILSHSTFTTCDRSLTVRLAETYRTNSFRRLQVSVLSQPPLHCQAHQR